MLNYILTISYEFTFPGYDEHYEVINRTQYRDLWELCFVTFASLDGTESREEGCR